MVKGDITMESRGTNKGICSKKQGIERRKRIMKSIKDYISVKGFPPSIQEIGDSVELSSKSSVHKHMEVLRNEGYISMENGIPRSIRVLKDFD